MNTEKQTKENLQSLLFDRLGFRPGECAGKTIVVTGAGRGIGLQTARAFALLGGRVILAELNPEAGQAAEDQIRAEGGQATWIQTDIADQPSVHSLAKQVQAGWGSVNVLVNNAILCPIQSILDMDEALWNRVIAVNLGGTFLTCKAFLPEMIARQQGTIINMVSTDAMPGLAAYMASKQAILSFTQSLAQELSATPIQAIPFAPGMVNTPGLMNVIDDLARRLQCTVEQIRSFSPHPAYTDLMPPEHAGAATVYLALRLAEAYRGKLVNGYEVLEQAGFIQTPAASDSAESGAPITPDLDDQRLVAALLGILDDTVQEFEKLPVFVRPLANGGFKKKTGHTPDEWRKIIPSLTNGKAPTGLMQDLDGLAGYYREAPAQMERFTRDPELLEQARRISRERIEIVRQYQQRLAQKQG